MVSGLILKSVISSESSFIQNLIYESNILLHADVFFSKHHLLKMLSFLWGVYFGFIVKIQVAIVVGPIYESSSLLL